MDINSLAELENLELTIKSVLGNLKLGDVLHSLYLLKKSSPELRPFMMGGAALFAIRFCPPSKTSQLIKNYDIRKIVHISNKYYLADPITFDKDLHDKFDENPVFMMLRVVSSQFPFEPGLFSKFSRPAVLFHEIPQELKNLRGIPEFDFDSKFKAITGVSVIDFITIGFVIFSVCRGNFVVSQDYFKKMRKQGINVSDQSLRAVLNQLIADKSKLVQLYENRKNPDRRFRMYDFNPLFSYPIIRPCQNKQFSTPDKDFIHAPVPELVASRISSGIFYQMFNKYGTEFSEYFGFVFERYVGLVLEKCLLSSQQLLSESHIRKFYPAKKGKAPDWIIVDGSTVLLFECKATRFSRAAQAIASEDSVNKSLAQVKKGLKQLASFISACQAKISELQKFHHCSTFKPIFVSLEPLFLINSEFFREHINTLLTAERVTGLDWQILSIDELEALQPHIAAGFNLSQVLDELRNKSFNDVHENLISQTNKSFAHSFLYDKQEELYQRLGLPE